MSDATSSAPLYSDRASGQVFPDARAMVNAYLERFASRAGTTIDALDDAGYTQLKKGSASVGVNVARRSWRALDFGARHADLPRTDRETLYRRLLELSYITTSDAAFAIDAARREDLRALAAPSLRVSITKSSRTSSTTVGKVADEWDDVLKNEFGDP